MLAACPSVLQLVERLNFADQPCPNPCFSRSHMALVLGYAVNNRHNLWFQYREPFLGTFHCSQTRKNSECNPLLQPTNGGTGLPLPRMLVEAPDLHATSGSC